MSAGTLYVLATPIGNLGDLSDRAKTVLREAALIVAEDTRRTRTLTTLVGAPARVMSYHAHSRPSRRAAIVRALKEGARVVLVSDAGTPAVSDPGADLVAAAREAGATVVAVPGPSAVTAALSVAGLPADRYSFLGFLPRRGAARRALLERIAASPWTVVLFESPQRLGRLLEDLAAACGEDRRAAVLRELTKVHEECRTGTLGELAGYYGKGAVLGEVTVVVGGRGADPTVPGKATDQEQLGERARALLDAGASRRDAALLVAREFGASRREAYGVVNQMQKGARRTRGGATANGEP